MDLGEVIEVIEVEEVPIEEQGTEVPEENVPATLPQEEEVPA